MSNRSDVGKDNAKVPDSDIQGDKAGKRNRAETEAGIKPAPAGETRPAKDAAADATSSKSGRG
jgi:hypothetical protein